MAKLQVGVDLGPRSVKLAVAQGGRVLTLAGFEDLSASELAPGGVNPALISWLELFVRENGLAGAAAVSGLAGDRLVVLGARAAAPSRRRRVSASSVPQALLHELPFVDPVVDVAEAGPAAPGGAPSLMVFAASRKTVDALAAALRAAGLVPAAVEPELAALARILAVPERAGRVVMDIGHWATQIGLVSGRRLLHLSTVGTGVGDAAGRLAAERGIDEDAAIGRILESRGAAEPDPVVEEIVEPVHRRLRGELVRSLATHGAIPGFPGDLEVVVIGGGARVLDVERILEGTGLRSGPLTLEASVELRTKTETSIEEELDRLCLAAGFALRGEGGEGDVNLLPPRDAEAVSEPILSRLRSPWVWPAATLALAVFLHSALSARVEALGRKLEDESARARASRQAEERLLGEARQRLDAGWELASRVEAARAEIPGCIADIGRATSAAARVVKIELQAPKPQAVGGPGGSPRLAISGAASSPREVARFVAALGSSDSFRSVQLRSMRGTGAEGDPVSFEIEAHTGKPEEEPR